MKEEKIKENSDSIEDIESKILKLELDQLEEKYKLQQIMINVEFNQKRRGIYQIIIILALALLGLFVISVFLNRYNEKLVKTNQALNATVSDSLKIRIDQLKYAENYQKLKDSLEDYKKFEKLIEKKYNIKMNRSSRSDSMKSSILKVK